MNKIIIKESSEHYWYLKEFNPDLLKQKRLSVSKLLGGKDNVSQERWYCYKGYGGWIIDYRIKDLNKAVASIMEHGFEVEMISCK